MDKALAQACSRIALEEQRPAAWKRAQELRSLAHERLKTQTREQVETWLDELTAAALHAQVRARGTTPTKGA